ICPSMSRRSPLVGIVWDGFLPRKSLVSCTILHDINQPLSKAKVHSDRNSTSRVQLFTTHLFLTWREPTVDEPASQRYTRSWAASLVWRIMHGWSLMIGASRLCCLAPHLDSVLPEGSAMRAWPPYAICRFSAGAGASAMDEQA